MCTVELVDFIHRETGQRIAPTAIDKMRRHLQWHVALSCVTAMELQASGEVVRPEPPVRH